METCARCKAEFGCGNVEGKTSCWCAELPPVMPLGDACLCPKCLKEEIARRVGDCLDCAHARVLKTKTGSAIFQCGLADKDARYEKFPRLPAVACAGREDKKS